MLKYYEDILSSDLYEKVDEFPDTHYEFLLMPLLISDDTIYIGNPADEGDTFYSVPKSLDSGLKMINVDAAVGIMTMQNKVYVGFTHLMLYYDVTTEASRSENGIKLASISIEEE